MRRWSWVSTFVLVMLLAAATTADTAGNEVIGFYRVEQVTDLGSQVRVTLHIRLTNNSASELSITQVALRDLGQPGKPAASAAWARLGPREATSVDNQFVISRAEYGRWSRGGRPALRVTFQNSQGRTLMRIVSLLPLSPRRAQ